MRPSTALRKVVLPHPDGPTIATNSPSPTSRSTPLTAVKIDSERASQYSTTTPVAMSFGGRAMRPNGSTICPVHGPRRLKGQTIRLGADIVRRQDMAATATSDLKRARVDLRDVKGPPAPKEALRSLPATIEWLRREGLLMETEVEVDGDLQLTGIQKHFDGSYPILFNRVKGYPHARAITNLFANMGIVDRMFGYDNATDRTRKLAHSLTHPIKNEVIAQDEAPCQEEVITDDLDVNKFIMAIRHTHLEGEITIGSGNSVVVGE